MAEALTQRGILAFWSPLALTWAIMGVEIPVVSIAVAALPDTTANLAALGAAIALAWFSETPTVNLTPATLRLASDDASYLTMRRYAIALCLLALGLNTLLAATPLMQTILQNVIGVPEDLSILAAKAYLWLLPWPAAIGMRRFYQAVMIRQGATRRVAYGTGIRLAVLSGAAALFATTGWLTGAESGALALSLGVIFEAVAARVMAAGSIHALRASVSADQPLTFSAFWQLYWPLTIMMMLNLAVSALVTTGLAKAKDAAVALAAFPVAHGVNFIARALATSFQEPVIAFLGRDENYRPVLAKFAVRLGIALTAVMAFLAFTPAGPWTLIHLMNLPAPLTEPAMDSFAALTLYPAVTLWFMWIRARLTHARRTQPIAAATVFETLALMLILWILITPLGIPGATAAGAAMVLSRIAANLWLQRLMR